MQNTNLMNNHILVKNLKLIFYNNILLLCNGYKIYTHKLPSKYYICKKENFIKLLFEKKLYYVTFLRHFLNFYNKIFAIFYFRLRLKGLGYRLYVISNSLIKIFLNRSNFFYIHIPLTILFKYRSRRLFFPSINYNILRVIFVNISLIKKFSVYKITGLLHRAKIILMKPGKNKFR